MKKIMSLALLSAVLSGMVACTQSPVSEQPQTAFLVSLGELCGKAFSGKLVSDDEADADFGRQSMVMHVRRCNENEVQIPFHVGDDHSRTWVITRQANGLRLKHDHRHADGSEDAVTQYGGDTADDGTPIRQEFPVDGFSIDMFEREGLTASVTNIWAVEITGDVFAYELRRENRFFRVEFDLAQPTTIPPVPWGYE